MDDISPTEYFADDNYAINNTKMLSEGQYDREIELVFRKSCLVVSHGLETPNPGGFLVRNLPGLKVNSLIIRSGNDAPSTFHNAYRRRGVMLACEKASNISRTIYPALPAGGGNAGNAGAAMALSATAL